MVTEWKVYQYSYKKGGDWKNVWVQSVNNWHRIESVPIQFREWLQESEKRPRNGKCTSTVTKMGSVGKKYGYSP
jgi:hypothetical protein